MLFNNFFFGGQKSDFFECPVIIIVSLVYKFFKMIKMLKYLNEL